MSIVSPFSPARNQWLTRVAGGRATTWPARIGISSFSAPVPAANEGDGQRWSVPSPSSMTKISSSSEWQWGTEPRAPGSSRSQWKPAWSERSFVASGAVVERPPMLELDLVDVEDVRWPLGRLAVGKRRRLGLAVPRVVDAPFDPLPPEPDRTRARQPAEVRRVPRAEDDVLEPVRPRDERVLELGRAMDDAVAGAHLVDLLVLPVEPRAREHVVDLLRRAVRVRRGRQLPGRDAHEVDADALRAGGLPEPLPGGVHLALCAAVRLDVVPVREAHGGNLVEDEPVAVHDLEPTFPGADLGRGDRGDSLPDRDTARRHELDRVAGAEAAVARRDADGKDTRPRTAQRTLGTGIEHHASHEAACRT